MGARAWGYRSTLHLLIASVTQRRVSLGAISELISAQEPDLDRPLGIGEGVRRELAPAVLAAELLALADPPAISTRRHSQHQRSLARPAAGNSQSEEYLDPDMRVPGPNGLVPVAVDWALVDGWRDAVSRLRDDASAELAPTLTHSSVSACAGTRQVG